MDLATLLEHTRWKPRKLLAWLSFNLKLHMLIHADTNAGAKSSERPRDGRHAGSCNSDHSCPSTGIFQSHLRLCQGHQKGRQVRIIHALPAIFMCTASKDSGLHARHKHALLHPLPWQELRTYANGSTTGCGLQMTYRLHPEHLIRQQACSRGCMNQLMCICRDSQVMEQSCSAPRAELLQNNTDMQKSLIAAELGLLNDLLSMSSQLERALSTTAEACQPSINTCFGVVCRPANVLKLRLMGSSDVCTSLTCIYSGSQLRNACQLIKHVSPHMRCNHQAPSSRFGLLTVVEVQS